MFAGLQSKWLVMLFVIVVVVIALRSTSCVFALGRSTVEREYLSSENFKVADPVDEVCVCVLPWTDLQADCHEGQAGGQRRLEEN
eukprot:2227595-Amphidinium_carterae.3